MDKRKRTKLFLMIFMILLYLVAGGFLFWERNYLGLVIVLLGILSVFLPLMIERKMKIDISENLEIVFLMFVWIYFYLGELRNFFFRFWWWDVMMHTIGLFLIGLFSFFIIYILNREKKVAVRLSPLFVALFAFSFALAIGALWEIFEFAMDSFFGLNMQKSGLVDTMWDLIVGAIGAFAASFVGFVYLKRNSIGFYKKVRGWVKSL